MALESRKLFGDKSNHNDGLEINPGRADQTDDQQKKEAGAAEDPDN